VHPQALHHILAIFGFSSNIQVVEYAWAKYHHYPRLNCARVPRKKNDTGKKQILEVIDPSRKTHEIDKMGLAGFLYDKGFSRWAGVRRGHGAGRQSCLPARPASA
jgi:hypothetical protein